MRRARPMRASVQGPRKSLLCAAIALSPVLIAVMVGTLAGVGYAGAAASVVSASHVAVKQTAAPRTADVVRGRFVATVRLDGGELTVVPAPAHDHPVLTEAQVAKKIWASPVLSGRQEGPLGYGLVTISLHVSGVPTVTRVLAWIGFATSTGAESCPVESPTSSTPIPSPASFPSNGDAAVVIGGTTGAPAVSYTARSLFCENIQPAALANATEMVSVRWEALGSFHNGALRVRAPLPACGTLAGISSGGTSKSETITVTVTVPDVRHHCAGPRTTTQTLNLGPIGNTPGAPPSPISATTAIVHGVLGPVLAATPNHSAQDPPTP
jgi:hypothetical protein